MRSTSLAILVVAAFPIVAQSHAASAPAAPSCRGPEHAQLDFWLGHWNAKWQGGHGSNLITKSYDGCVIEEHFDGRPSEHLQGHSVSMYFAPSRNWRQTWVDNEDGYFDLAGGPNGRGDFVLTTLPHNGTSTAERMIFTAIKANSFIWRWQGTKNGKTWTDLWVIAYSRRTV